MDCIQLLFLVSQLKYLLKMEMWTLFMEQICIN
ncbi:hypothetical protein SAMN04488688_110162 [Paenibacillus sp. cl141a]|nr:hypothetical protein SAMN04488688_110162 [Paenibacillus sp. cl141a]